MSTEPRACWQLWDCHEQRRRETESLFFPVKRATSHLEKRLLMRGEEQIIKINLAKASDKMKLNSLKRYPLVLGRVSELKLALGICFLCDFRNKVPHILCTGCTQSPHVLESEGKDT